MQLEFNRQKIANEQDVVDFRKKVYQALLICFDSSSFSVKIATMLSSLLKKLIAQHDSIYITSDIQSVGEHVKNIKIKVFDPFYAITIPEPTLYLHHVKVNKVNDTFEITIDQSFPYDRLEDAVVVFNERSRDELMVELQSKNKDLKDSLENLKQAKDNNARMESELTVGRNIQMSMLPTDFPSNENIELHAKLVPAREVGGDFYDFQIIDDNVLYFVVGDVSGKGVPAALLMAMTKSLLRSNAISEKSTSKIISHVNSEIAKDNKNNMFITIFLALLNFRTGELTYTNAGHNPSYVLSENNKALKLEDRHGPVVGALEGFNYQESTVQLKTNDLIFAYTDGVTEAQNKSRELYSDQRLENLIENHKHESVKKLVNKVINDVGLHEKESEQADDITVLSIKYTKASSPDFEIEFDLDYTEKEKITPQISSFFYDHKYPIGLAQKVQIILDELISNAINYSSNSEEKNKMLVKVFLLEQKKGVEIKLIDNGIPFNPLESDIPDTSLSVDERPIGGLGIHIVKNLVEHINYQRHQEQNIITLQLKK